MDNVLNCDSYFAHLSYLAMHTNNFDYAYKS
jgi:hypothetical protein